MLFGSDNRKRWSKLDIVLAQAHHILQSERCKQCGLPKYICQNPSRELEYRMEKETCYATQALDKHEKAEESRRKKSSRGQDAPAPAGEAAYPVPYLRNGADLGTLRDPYYEERARIAEAVKPKLAD
ncbi:hypothetical protein [Microbacterium sp. No. 7]|uniref:hypothetical protein n=1 Tax=Microbacterium sp. No. 7 TaxID=1714373 RepID=UPI0006D211A6|nr:hypothetical protein [Microbacterium sp. No. 7]ALJ19579.1 hypothetical protein AOA12_06515 [Microbacterium sp. No. 7]